MGICEIFCIQGNELGNLNCQPGFGKQKAFLHSVHIGEKFKEAKSYI